MLVSLENYFIFSRLASGRIELAMFDGVQLFCNLNIQNINDVNSLLGVASKPDSRNESWEVYAQKLLAALHSASSTDFKFDILLKQGFLTLTIWEKISKNEYLKLLDRYDLRLVDAGNYQLGLTIFLTNIATEMKSDKQEIETIKQKSARLENDNKLLQNELAKSIKESNNVTNKILENVYILHSAKGYKSLNLSTNISGKKNETIEESNGTNKNTDDATNTLITDSNPVKRKISQITQDTKPVIKQDHLSGYELLGKKIIDANEFTSLHSNTPSTEQSQTTKHDLLESSTNSAPSSLPSFLRKRIPQLKPPSNNDDTNPLAYI